MLDPARLVIQPLQGLQLFLPPQPALQHAEAVQESVQKAAPPPQFGATNDDIQRTAPKRSVTPDGK